MSHVENSLVVNGRSDATTISNHETHEATAIGVFSDYIRKLLPSNKSWMSNGMIHNLCAVNVSQEISDNDHKEMSSKVKNGISEDLSVLEKAVLNANSSNNNFYNHGKMSLSSKELLPENMDDSACPVEIAMSEIAGRYLKAKRNISPGEVIFVEPPVVLAARPKSAPHCSSCYRFTNSFKCPDCGFFFCGPKCLTQDHKIECQSLRHLGTADHPEDMNTDNQQILERLSQMSPENREQAEALLKKAKSASKEQKHSEIIHQYVIIAALRTLFIVQKSDFYKRLILSMQANLVPKSPRYQMNQKLIVSVIKERLQVSTDPELLHRICSIWDTNAFQVVLPQNGMVQGLYPFAGLINHDCRPNAQQWFSSTGEFVLKATDHIAKGEVVSISYTDPQWSTIVRQNHLQKCKQFTCICCRCLDPSELGTFTGSLVCPLCSSPMVSSAPLDTAAPWVCKSAGCTQTMPAIQEDENRILSLGANLGALIQKVNRDDVKVVMSLVRVLQKQVHPNHFCLMQLYLSVLSTLVKKNLSELTDEDLLTLSGISAQAMRVVRLLQSPLARITVTTAREDLRLRLETIKRNQMKLGTEAVQHQLKEMTLHLQECVQVLQWDPSMPSADPLLQDYQNLINTS